MSGCSRARSGWGRHGVPRITRPSDRCAREGALVRSHAPGDGAMPQVLVTVRPGSRRIRASPVRNAFGGHVMGSTARLRRSTSRSGSPGEQHQVPVALVYPEGEPAPAAGVREFDASDAVDALEVGEGVVELGLADRSRLAEVVVGAVDRSGAGRDAAFVGPQHGPSGCAQDRRVDVGRPDRQVRMGAGPVRTGACP
jgi:hypothetical protein